MKWSSSVIVSLFLCLLAEKGMSQPAYKVPMPKVAHDAFYCIDLPYEVLGEARRDLADIRILDSEGKEIAWFLREETDAKNNSEFIPLPAEISSLPRRTDILITGAGKPLSSFVLKIKNADVNKEAALLGSNDGQKWFGVKDRFRLNRTSSPDQTEALLDLSFPLSDYQFYKLSLNDSLTAPLNVIGVGQVQVESYSKPHLLEVPLTNSRIQTKGKETEIELVLPFKLEIERFDFYISSPRYYRRSVRLMETSNSFATTLLSDAGGNPQPVLMRTYNDTIRLSVSNGDDRPLGIDSMKVYMRKYCLIAALERGEQYTLAYGDPKATFPQYDLSFKEQVPEKINHVFIYMKDREQKVVKPQEEGDSAWLRFFKTYGIWIIIVLIIAQILYMVRKMLK